MEKLRGIRGYILGASVGMLLLPTYVVLAAPVTAQSNIDLSWIADLPPIIVLCILMFLVLYFVLKFTTDRQNRITVQTPDGQPNKTITTNEFMGTMFQQFIDVVKSTGAQNRETTLQFGELVKQIMEDVNQHQNMVRDALASQKDEIIQGRGNQMTAIVEISDNFTNAMRQMQTALSARSEQMERVNGGIGYLQLGQTKMQENLNSLLAETRKLTESVAAVLARIEQIDETMITVNDSELAVKKELEELTTLVHSLGDRLNNISIAAGGTPSANHMLPAPEIPAKPKEDITDV